MTAEWYYAKGDKRHGPVTEDRLRELAESGELLPTDRVWRKGTKGWVEAGTVPDLFPDDGPPPLDVTLAGGKAHPLKTAWGYCTKHPALCAAGGLAVVFPLSLLVPTTLASLDLDGLASVCGVPLVLADLGLFAALFVFGLRGLFRSIERDSRRQMLQGSLVGGNKKWEPVDGDGPSLLFFSDGGFLRGDGFGAKFLFDPDADEITFTVPGFEPSIRVRVLSVTADELVVLADGRSLHYKAGKSISGERQAESRARQKEFLKAAAGAVGSGAVAVGAAALGVLVLGAAVAGAAAAVPGGGGTPAGGGATQPCVRCGKPVPLLASACPHCGASRVARSIGGAT